MLARFNLSTRTLYICSLKTHPCLNDDIQDPGRTSKMRPTLRQYGEKNDWWTITSSLGGCRMVPHRAPGSSPPLVGFAVRKVVPGTGVWWGRERTGLGGAGRALGHGAVLLRGRTVVRVTLAGVHLLVAEVDAQNLPRRLPLATRYRALGHRKQRVMGPVRTVGFSLSVWCFHAYFTFFISFYSLTSLETHNKSPLKPKPELSYIQM